MKKTIRLPKVLILSNIHSALTGVWKIDRAHDLVVLNYTDGISESAMVPVETQREIGDDVLRIVSIVQSLQQQL